MRVEVFHDSFQLCKGRIAHVVHPVYQLMLLGGRHWNGDTQNIPEELLIEDPERCVRIPMWGETRSLNLSNSVAIILYEALRQNGFEKMNTEGHLHHLQWK